MESKPDRPFNLNKSALRGFAWQYTSFIIQAVLQLVVLAVLARLLTPEDFGVLGIAMIVVGLAALFSQLGVGPALIQRSELTSVHIRVGFTISILFSLVLTILVMAISPWAAHFLENEQVEAVLFVVSINFFLTGFGVVAESLLKRNLHFKRLMWASVGSYFLGYAVVGTLLAWLGYGVWALVGATLGQSLVNSILLIFLNPHPFKPSLARKEAREILFFGGGFTLARFLNYSANQGDYLVVGKMMDAATLGIYSRAYQLMMMPAKYFSQVLSVVLFPVMARLQADRSKLTNAYLEGIAIVAMVCTPLGALMIVSAPEIVAVVLGAKWSSAVLPFQILSIGVMARSSYKIDDALARALGAMYRRSARDAVYAAAVVIGSLAGLRWGLTGVAVGVLGAVIINYILALRMSVNLLDCSWSKIKLALMPTLLPTLVVAVVSLVVRSFLIGFDLPAWLILAVTTLMSGLALASLFLVQPQILGFYATKMARRFLPMLPIQFFPKSVSQWLLAKLA